MMGEQFRESNAGRAMMGDLWLESDGGKHQQQSNDEGEIPGEQCWLVKQWQEGIGWAAAAVEK